MEGSFGAGYLKMCIRDSYVMTTFYPYQWDLNYGNPRVFNEMMYNFLFFANQGMDIIPVSYTHLDVYKRQLSRYFCKHIAML